LSLSIALLVSMVVSLTLIPVLAARFLAHHPMPANGRIYNALANVYERLLKAALCFPRTVVALAILAVVPGYFVYQHLKVGLMPDMDEGAFVLDYFLPAGTSLTETDAVARRIDAILDETPDVSGYLRRTGAENGLYATENFKGDIEVALKPPGKRRPLQKIFEELEEKLKSEVPDAKTEVHPLIRDQLDDLMGSNKPVEVKIFGSDANVLRELAEKVGKAVEESGCEANSHVLKGNPDLHVRPIPAVVARAGLTEQDIYNQLNTAFYGQVAATLPQQDRITNIRVRYPDHVRYNRDQLAQLPIAIGGNVSLKSGSSPGFAMLGQLATIDEQRSPNEVLRENQQPMISVTGEYDEEKTDLGSVSRKIQAALATISFPRGYRWELAGEFKSQQESFASLLMVMLAASAIVFLLLGFQFRSLTLPLLIYLSQPISLASALTALWITGTPLNVSSFMGAILLIGLDVKNGIILIEYVGQLREGGMPLDEALIVAGRTRFRPILMTSLTTILGLAPLALGLGPGAQMQQPLAIAVIGGLIVNMLLTRLLIPVGYLVLRR
jgi:multidrug efflux pump subunit AcrB